MQARHGLEFDTAGVGMAKPNFRRALRVQTVAQLQGQHEPQVHLELFFYEDAQDVDARQPAEAYGAERVRGGGF